ncbi:MAG: pyruvate:ferredoxin (flavodoxin) oxidoreductase, partial [Anaerolineales bacterium]|nr:pyruvate:ferredoxin (flavodoxin) oxidoreductase [Anaerolineales bacterium]
EPGSAGEPLYLDVVAALHEAWEGAMPTVIGGRYGLSSKEFTPAMARAVFDELDKVWADGRAHRRHFTVGIKDDVTHLSLDYDPAFNIESPDTVRAMFFGLGSDGTVGANKNSIKIIGEDTPNHAQGYFVYDSKKSGSVTVSHLRFGPRPIRAPFLVEAANFVACHQFSFLERFDMLKYAVPGAVFLLNSPHGPETVWNHLPRSVQQQIIDKGLRFYVIDALKVAREAGMGGRINTVMQVCFFAISGVLPKAEAIEAIKNSIRKTYGKRGEAVVQKNFAAVDAALEHLYEVDFPREAGSLIERRAVVPASAPDFIKKVTAPMMAGLGDDLPVSALPADGTYPTGTTKWEKRNIATEIPVWDPAICIQCGKCSYVCPHGVIREKVYEPVLLDRAPAALKRAPARFKEFKDMAYTLQVAPEDCTGCGICVEACPVKNKTEARLRAINMQPQAPLREQERLNWEFFQTLPEVDRTAVPVNSVKYSQLLTPLFEFSGACAGCGETPYLKLISQLFGDRALIANATGCSSIYGGNLPTTPWTQNKDGRGPAWANSLFEDNAEFGYGMRLAVDHQLATATQLLAGLHDTVGADLAAGLLQADQSDEAGVQAQRNRVADLKRRLTKRNGKTSAAAARLLDLADIFVRRSVWIVGGDGWAYDIGYGGLDHVLAAGRKVNVLVMDTEVYSNTGGQMSKATPRAAVAKFAAAGKPMPKKDLALLAVSYGHIYVARVAMGADDEQAVKAIAEAEAYNGPALIIAYAHCIAHGYDLKHGLSQQKLAVQSGYWPLFRYNPALKADGKNPFLLDSKPPIVSVDKYMYNEGRFNMLSQSHPDEAHHLLEMAQSDVNTRWTTYERLAKGQ